MNYTLHCTTRYMYTRGTAIDYTTTTFTHFYFLCHLKRFMKNILNSDHQDRLGTLTRGACLGVWMRSLWFRFLNHPSNFDSVKYTVQYNCYKSILSSTNVNLYLSLWGKTLLGLATVWPIFLYIQQIIKFYIHSKPKWGKLYLRKKNVTMQDTTDTIMVCVRDPLSLLCLHVYYCMYISCLVSPISERLILVTYFSQLY